MNTFTYAEAQQSPCASCASAPCCRYLPLQTLEVRDLSQMDYLRYLLNFDRIVLGLSAEGAWSVYYRQSCRYLDPRDHTCTIHDQPEQPSICVHYNPYACFYKSALAGTRSDFLFVDRARMQAFMERVVFDQDRALVQVPDWETLCATLTAIPYIEPKEDVERAADDSVRGAAAENGPKAGRADSRGPDAAPSPLRTLEDAMSPCTGCQAHCCKVLQFPMALPTSLAQLDHIGFCLGFPGVELGVEEGAWSLLVSTTCQHLADDRCTIFGRPERPMVCRYFDALQCQYKPRAETPHAVGFVRLGLEAFRRVSATMHVDDAGTLASLPTAVAIGTFLETGDPQALIAGEARPQSGRPAARLPAAK